MLEEMIAGVSGPIEEHDDKEPFQRVWQNLCKRHHQAYIAGL